MGTRKLLADEGPTVRSSLLDVLRILAIGLIVTGHLGDRLDLQLWWGKPYDTDLYYFDEGTLAITILLLISGIGLRLREHGKGILAFYVHRLQRIYPVYWMALSITIVLGLMFHWDTVPKTGIDWALSITGLCVFGGRGWLGCGFTPAWFIGLMLSLYTLYPVLSRCLKLNPPGTLIILFFISVVSRLTVEGYFPNYPKEWFPLCRVFEFGLGIYLAQAGWLVRVFQWTAPPSIKRTLEVLSELSFPVFLLHWTFYPVLNHFGSPLHVLLFLAMTMIGSYTILYFDSYVQHAVFGKRQSSRVPWPAPLGVWTGRPARWTKESP